jgi:hypothetical protein
MAWHSVFGHRNLPAAVQLDAQSQLLIVWQLRYAKTFFTSCHPVFNLGIYRSGSEETALLAAWRFEFVGQ